MVSSHLQVSTSCVRGSISRRGRGGSEERARGEDFQGESQSENCIREINLGVAQVSFDRKSTNIKHKRK